MTRERVFGEDTPFGAWVRSRPELDSVRHALTVNDVDMMFHKYKTVVDRLGTRDVQLHMMLEVKSRNAVPNDNQRQTLFDQHQLLSKRRRLWDARSPGSKRSVWHFGVNVLSMSGEDPATSESLRWLSFDKRGALSARRITESDLVKILGFDIAPDTLKEMTGTLRRHHQTRILLRRIVTPLGFETEELVKESS